MMLALTERQQQQKKGCTFSMMLVLHDQLSKKKWLGVGVWCGGGTLMFQNWTCSQQRKIPESWPLDHRLIQEKGAIVKVYITLHLLYTAAPSPGLHHPPLILHSNSFTKLTSPSIYFTWQLVHQVDIAFHLLYTATQVHFALCPQKRDGLLGTGTGGKEEERVKARPRIPPKKDWRDRGPPPEQWKC